jgi:hypothetical protein
MQTVAPTSVMNASDAREAILAGTAPDNLKVKGKLDLSEITTAFQLPAGLQSTSLNLEGSTGLQALPSGLDCFYLNLSRTQIRELPSDLKVEYMLNLDGCSSLESLPPDLKVGSLVLRDCVSLKALPEGLQVYFLDLTGCSQLERLPQHGSLTFGRLVARGCRRLRELPKWIDDLSQLDLSGCESLSELPPNLRVASWIDIADTQISTLPSGVKQAKLRWRGVEIDERIIFRPETITGQEVLQERNAERRRVMLARMGYDAFLSQVNAKVLNKDEDSGGERRLLRVEMPGDEPLVCLAVYCPSTARQYLLRVPPTIRSCHQAAAWIAGFDDPSLYKPIAES